MAGVVEVEANLQEQLSDQLHFRQDRAAQTLAYSEMQRDSVLDLFHNRIKLGFQNGPSEFDGKLLSMSLIGSALEWRTWTHGKLSDKQPVNAVHACNELPGHLQISPSSHLNSDSSHFNERSLQWVSLCLARELLNYSSIRTRHTIMDVRRCGKVLIRIFDIRKVGRGHGVQFAN